MSAKIDHIHVVLPAAGGRSDERLTIGRTAELDHDAAPPTHHRQLFAVGLRHPVDLPVRRGHAPAFKV